MPPDTRTFIHSDVPETLELDRRLHVTAAGLPLVEGSLTYARLYARRSDEIALVAEIGVAALYLKSVPRPVRDSEAVRHVIGGPVVARHRCRSRPGEVVVQHLSQSTIVS